MLIADAVKSKPCKISDTGNVVLAIQTALNAAGYTLELDGDFGANTQRAVKAFQASHGLPFSGEVDLVTGQALDKISPPPPPSVMKIAPWLATMRSITGTKEAPSSKDNPFIIEMAHEIVRRYPDLKGTVGWYDHDSIPWCGLGMAYCMAVNGVKPPLYALSALAWADWGQKLKGPSPGAVLVYSRTGGGHVTLYESEDSNYFYCRGGNQSDSVNVTRIPKSRPVKAIRWPVGFPLPTAGRKIGATGNAIASGSEA